MIKLNNNIKKRNSTLDLAKKFLNEQIEKKEFVINNTEIPTKEVREFLQANNYLYSPCKYIYIIKDDKVPNKYALEHNYFNIISKLWQVVSWKIALNYHIGKTTKIKNIEIITTTKNWEMNLGEDDTYIVKYRKSEIFREIEKVKINNSNIYIETATSYLINNFNEDNTNDEDFKILLWTTNFMLWDIKNFIEKWTSIKSLSRMALRYKENNNPRNYTLIKTALKQTGKRFNYSKETKAWWDTEELSKLFSTSLEYDNTSPDVNPKIERFKNYINKLEKQCENYLEKENFSNIKFEKLNNLLKNVEHNIVNDSYHSLTIENYKVTKKDIDILKDEIPEEKNKDIQNKLIIKWYLSAYKEIVEQIKIDYWYGMKINKSFIKNINWKLFFEISKAKWFDFNNDYRTHNVEITWSKHLPPDHRLIDEYMDIFIEYINKLDNSDKAWIIKKAIMTHFLFVYIHPFWDGNWRTARFLMNYTLGSEKLNWITILSHKKDEYIKTLKKASENEDITSFTSLIINYLKE